MSEVICSIEDEPNQNGSFLDKIKNQRIGSKYKEKRIN